MIGAEKPTIHLTWKELHDGRKLLYLVNDEKESQSVSIQVEGWYDVRFLDVLKEQEEETLVKVEKNITTVELEFAEYGSMVLIFASSSEEDCMESQPADVVETKRINLDNMFHIHASDV